MSASLQDKLRQGVENIETTPAIPAVVLPLLDLLNLPADKVNLDQVVKLVSYDNTIAAQCLRVASSPIFGLAKSPESIKAAVISLGLRRVETILLTCCMGKAFPAKKWALDPIVFWRHSLGCAMVCRKFSEKLGGADSDKAYTAGLLHDIGFLVNCMAFPKEFTAAIAYAAEKQVPFDRAESEKMGFTHCESGRALAEKWNLSPDIVEVVAYHHEPQKSVAAPGLVALVHLSDLLCRMRNLGYGYYERQKVDLLSDPAWAVLAEGHRALDGVDLVRFTFELDEAVEKIYEMVSMIFGSMAVGRAG
ncbi:MAG TPA: HDOD domain-containing protein [Candidatus Binatia bacterium]|nr:HDOD domain-containing protein [Candidatus Binatia bacterium]